MKEILLPKVGQVIIISDYYKGERLTINQALPWLSFTSYYSASICCREACNCYYWLKGLLPTLMTIGCS